MSFDVRTLLSTGAALTDDALERLLPAATTPPHSIHRAMRHSTFAGGKRLRPILLMEAARALAGTLPQAAVDAGAAVEMLHTYSLIHDDLPALDNDDLRRGKPTCHVAFGESTAILAGDALQTLAFQTLASLHCDAATAVAVLREVAIAVGTGVGRDLPGSLSPGMIGGQVMDMEGTGGAPSADLVERIHRAKTGALITVSIVAGGLIGLGARSENAPHQSSGGNHESAGGPFIAASGDEWGTSNASSAHQSSGGPFIAASGDEWGTSNAGAHDVIARLRTFGEKAGLAFQIVDDILDMTQTSAELGKTAGKDTATDKATWPAVFGIEQSRHDAAALIADAFAAVAPLGDAATPLKALAQYLVDRTH